MFRRKNREPVNLNSESDIYDSMIYGPGSDGVRPHLVIHGFEGASVPFDRSIIGQRVLSLLRRRQAEEEARNAMPQSDERPDPEV